MIKKLLIANRGEIAVRIIRTARKMGIKTVSVYSDADRNAMHTRLADEAIYIGAAPSRESYLRIDRIIDAARQTAADAIHPGYGFLSENPEFAQALASEGILFVGPPPDAMRMMGSKIEAKQLARKMNVPLVPGTDKAIFGLEEAKSISHKTGYPLLIKASAGGGGKGMRLVHHESELEAQLRSASSEALSAFGDGSVFIEKYVSKPRHIEIQIFTDQYGNGVFLFERECSIQRRHQKIIEEAPSSCLSKELRNRMGQDALKLALACGYVGAGTIEFLLDADKNYYFLEMNTRLQVEHPVTEMITGLDLVQMQLEIADGTPLQIHQEDLQINGHSIELRVCAEDPAHQFLPSIGTLSEYEIPEHPWVRVDDCFEQGMEIPIQYDPLIAKLIVHGHDRLDAINKMKSAIQNYKVDGVETTLDYGYFVMEHPDFLHGNFDTAFVEKHYEQYLESRNDLHAHQSAAFLALHLHLNQKNKITLPLMKDQAWYKNRKEF